MSREIKFRVFRSSYGDDGGPKMTEPFTMGHLQDNDQFDFTDGTYASWDEFGLEHKGTVIMQFTGLKDENGKDIYEDDILKVGVNGPLIVQWNKKQARWEAAHPNGDYLLDFPLEEVVVEGNMHEQPELLEEKA